MCFNFVFLDVCRCKKWFNSKTKCLDGTWFVFIKISDVVRDMWWECYFISRIRWVGCKSNGIL